MTDRVDKFVEIRRQLYWPIVLTDKHTQKLTRSHHLLSTSDWRYYLINCAEWLREDTSCTDCDQIIDNVGTFQRLVWKLEYRKIKLFLFLSSGTRLRFSLRVQASVKYYRHSQTRMKTQLYHVPHYTTISYAYIHITNRNFGRTSTLVSPASWFWRSVPCPSATLYFSSIIISHLYSLSLLSRPVLLIPCLHKWGCSAFSFRHGSEINWLIDYALYLVFDFINLT